jgi:long-chain acyl-CoA synthetase
VTHINPVFGDNRIGTIGLPVPGTDAKVVDAETGSRELPPGQVGEMIVRGPQVMKGYWRDDQATSKAVRDGWLFTGDLVRRDEDGYFEVVDRKKDLILATGGLNVYPREIEEVLHLHPKVRDCAAIGVSAGAEKGERVKVFVVLREGKTSSVEEIRAFCQQNLAPYKVPRYVEFRSSLPVSNTGKIVRRLLRE